jgi:outer membrane receptor protein involved in Fe transport
MTHLLSPVGGGTLSQFASQQQYSRMFEHDGPGIISSTDYLSDGSWHQSGSQYGTFGDFSYALDVDYLTLNGQRPNNDFDSLSMAGRFKYQITPADSVYLEVQYNSYEFGDVRQLYYQTNASTTIHVEETQAPNVFAGYHHGWSTGSHTLVLVGRLDDTLTQSDTNATVLTLNLNPAGQVTAVTPRAFGLSYERDVGVYTAEAQQIWQPKAQTIVVGVRYQTGNVGTDALLERNPVAFPPIYSNPPSDQQFDNNLQRFSAYAYDYWQPTDNFELIAGVSYDWLQYPVNSEIPPLSNQETSTGKVSPKVGLMWTPLPDTTIRGAYTRSLGGVFFDNSVRLEPTQIAGFNQAFRSLIPESIVGLVPGAEFETWGVALDQRFKSGTYVNVTGEILKSTGQRVVGVFDFTPPSIPAVPSGTTEDLDFDERNLYVTVNQLIGEMFSVGATYRITDAELSDDYIEIPATVAPAADSDVGSTLQQLFMFARVNHPSGIFGEFDSIWSHQSNRGYAQNLPGEDLWQFNAFVGYRFLKRRMEVRVGVFNLTDQDYQLNPLTLYSELPRERLFAASFRFFY